jgi:hypothetical protein
MASSWTQTGSRSARAVQQTTEVAPTVTDKGVPLEGVDSVMPVVKAPDGQTFTGTGTLLGYVYAAGRWVRAPRADRDLSDLAGLLEGALDAQPVISKAGYFIWIPSGVGLSGGTEITTDYVCTLGSGRPTV